MSFVSDKMKLAMKKTLDVQKNIQKSEESQKELTPEEIKDVLKQHMDHFDKEIDKFPFKREPFRDAKGANILMVVVSKPLDIVKNNVGDESNTKVSCPLFEGFNIMLFGKEEDLKKLVVNPKSPYYFIRGKATGKYKLASDKTPKFYGNYLSKFLTAQDRDDLNGYKDGDVIVNWNFNLYQILR